jgi:hypothetical protein
MGGALQCCRGKTDAAQTNEYWVAYSLNLVMKSEMSLGLLRCSNVEYLK